MQGPHIQYKNETRKRYTLSIALLSNKHITDEPPLSGRPSIKWSVIKVSNNNNRFEDAERLRVGDYLILSIARSLTNVILAGKRDSCRYFTTSLSLNVVVAETSYQMLDVLLFCDPERAYPPSIKITVLTFLVNQKYSEAFWRLYFFENTR